MCASNRGTNGAAPFDSDRSRQRSGVQHCVSVGSSLISQRAITQKCEANESPYLARVKGGGCHQQPASHRPAMVAV
eukprot:scaffold62853_cov21-Tisochrysis_lutea.AAC.1